MSILLGTFYNNWLFCIAWLMYELIQMQRRDPQLNYSWGKTIFTGICKRLHTSIGVNQILLAVMNFEPKCTKIGVTVPFFYPTNYSIATEMQVFTFLCCLENIWHLLLLYPKYFSKKTLAVILTRKTTCFQKIILKQLSSF